VQRDVRSWGKLTLRFQIGRMRRATALAGSSLMFRSVATTVPSP
jgi:hypothetical protein